MKHKTNDKQLWNKKGRTRIEYWESKGRWFWHRIVNGKVTADGSYAQKSSLRRALKQHFGPEDATRAA